MKKTLLLLFAALLGGVNVVNAETKISIGEPSNNTTDDSSNAWYDSSTKTITFFSQWSYRPGWWIGGSDYSSYQQFVVEFEGTVSNKIQVLVDCGDAGNLSGNNGDSHDNKITVALDSKASAVQQIYFQLADALGDGETASVKFKDAYFLSESDRATLSFNPASFNQHWSNETYDETTHTIQFDEEWKGIGWWLGNSYPLYKSAVFIFEPTASSGQLAILCNDNTENASKWFAAGSTYAVCDISGCTKINQFMLQAATANTTVVLKAAYFSTLNATDEEAYVTSHAWPLIIKSSGYASFASDNALDFSEVDGLEAYIVSSLTSTEATMKKVNEAPAQTGLILKGTAGTVYQVPIVPSAASVGTNKLKAAVTATDVTANSTYVLSDGQFKKFTGTSIPAGKAYLLAEDIPAEAHELSINFGDATGIKNIKVGTEDNIYYDLQGRRVLYPTKGLYIVNGKKVIVK